MSRNKGLGFSSRSIACSVVLERALKTKEDVEAARNMMAKKAEEENARRLEEFDKKPWTYRRILHGNHGPCLRSVDVDHIYRDQYELCESLIAFAKKALDEGVTTMTITVKDWDYIA